MQLLAVWLDPGISHIAVRCTNTRLLMMIIYAFLSCHKVLASDAVDGRQVSHVSALVKPFRTAKLITGQIAFL